MKTADFDFDLSKERIADRPVRTRDNSRLLVLHRNGSVEHKKFRDVVQYLNKGDMLLLNDTKVFPARITGRKLTGGKIDMLLVRETDSGAWEIMSKGDFDGVITVFDGVKADIWTEAAAAGNSGNGGAERAAKRYLRIHDSANGKIYDMLWQYGCMPLPPYIKRMPDNSDKERYQTVYAKRQGSIAAPTAGLHFTNGLLDTIEGRGVAVRALTLHVGSGTFKPIKAERLSDHNMDSEFFEVESRLLDEMRDIKRSGGRLITVGTTATRAIEGLMSGRYIECLSPAQGQANPAPRGNGSIRGYTDIFIYPGYEFKAVDSMITNFHLPRSSPLMLVSALAGFQKITKAYGEAIAMNYRFFSYGDAMLIL